MNIDLVSLLQGVPGIGPYLPFLFIVFGFCAVLAAQLPPPAAAGGMYGLAWQVVNLLGHNYRFAGNAAQPPAGPPAVPPRAAIALLAVVAAAGLLSACAGTTTLAQVEVALTGAETAATAYVKLPLCPQPGGAWCSDPAITAKIKAADMLAYTSVQNAKHGTATPDQAMADVQALAVLIPAQK